MSLNVFASYSQQHRGHWQLASQGSRSKGFLSTARCQALSVVQGIQQRTRQTGPTGSLRDSSLVGMVDNQQENKHTVKTISDCVQTVGRRKGCYREGRVQGALSGGVGPEG